MKFRFDTTGSMESGKESADGTIYVAPEWLYGDRNSDSTLGYGFLTEKNRNRNKRLQIPEINSGLNTVYGDKGAEITELAADKYGCHVIWGRRRNPSDLCGRCAGGGQLSGEACPVCAAKGGGASVPGSETSGMARIFVRRDRHGCDAFSGKWILGGTQSAL